jgi:L,D-transpeptidase YcbB
LSTSRIPRSAWLVTAAALLCAPIPALAAKKKAQEQPEISPTLLVGFSQGAAVQAYYKRWKGPQWFKPGNESVVAQLANVLRRAPLDGLSQGASLASQVESAARQAGSGERLDVLAAEHVLSAAWVTYVETISRPTQDMIYGYASLAPQPVRAEQVLAAAAGAPSLAQHLDQVAAVNPIYSKLRAAAWTKWSSNQAITPDPRIAMNLARLRSLPKTQRFAIVNIASQTLTMYEGGQAVDSMKVIVGMKDLPTPMISSVIYYATFNPYWNVPEHLVRKTVAPNVIKGGLGYLSTRGYQVMTSWSADATSIAPGTIDWAAVAAGTTKVRVRQMPNAGNSMGKIKFSFANGEGIFLHDTPSKDLFAKAERTLSNGCVRLQDAARFGRWLLKREPVAPSSTPEQFVPLPVAVPIYISYLTAAENGGRIEFLNDIYGWDSGGSFKALGASTNLAR